MNFFNIFFKKSSGLITCEPLTDSSPIVESNIGKFELWRHQKAMLHKCLLIEEYNYKVKIVPRNVDFMKVSKHMSRDAFIASQTKYKALGIMNDGVGAGKTNVMLTLLGMDNTKNINIVIVPPNLHFQWIESIEKYLPSLKYLAITTYAESLDLMRDKALNDINLIITTTMYIDVISDMLKSSNKKLNRVIIDEIDTASTNFNNIPSCQRIWFMSASYDPNKEKNIGPFDLSELSIDEIGKIISRCDQDFMRKCQNIKDEPQLRIIKVPDGDISLLLGLIEKKNEILLNAMNIKRVKNNLLIKKDIEIKSVYDIACQYLKELESCKLEDEIYEDKIELLKDRLSKRQVEKSTKMDEIIRIMDDIKKEDCKYIFFSDDDNIYDQIEIDLKKRDIKYSSMNGGTTDKNVEAILEYKQNKDVKVLLLNSTKDGCGLNLENTTHILLLHYTNEKMIEQVIGRAHRPGRTCVLQVIGLYYENEIPNLEIEHDQESNTEEERRIGLRRRRGDVGIVKDHEIEVKTVG